MITSINNLIETISNPEGRFLTLQGIYAEVDSVGIPIFTIRSGMVCFRTIWRGKRYMLKCRLVHDDKFKKRMVDVCRRLNNVRPSYLVECRYLSDEMLIFDDLGSAFRVDVMIMEIAEGVTLSKYLAHACDAGDVGRVLSLLKSFCDVGRSLIDSDLNHCNIKPSNIIVNDDNRVKLINYEYMNSQCRYGAETFQTDNISIANIALVLKVLAYNPEAFRSLSGSSLFRLPVMRSYILPAMESSAREGGCEPMMRIIDMVNGSNNSVSYSDELRIALESLSSDRTELSFPLGRDSLMDVDLDRAQSFDLSQYDWCGVESEGLIAVQKGDVWGYVNIGGDVIIDLKYDWVGDFCEGRAVVIEAGNYAMVDKGGVAILPPKYEFIDWSCTHGIAKVTFDGFNGIYDRMGVELVPVIYDWMGELDSDLILVRKDSLCGYIDKRGNVKIPFVYEDAFDFDENGVALVTLDGESFEIDMNGNRI